MNDNSSEYKEKLIELKKCKNDPTYFIGKYVKVVHPIRGLVPFKLYPFQQSIINDLQNHRFNVLRKFRQAGCTTIASSYALWFCLFFGNKTVAVLSKGEVEATEIIERIKLMYEELPDWLKQFMPLIEDNKHSIKFKNGSRIKSRSSAKQSGRSISGSLLIIDEAAFVENIRELWAAVYPIISTGGRAFVLSTVNGIGNWFYETYTEAVKKVNAFHAIDITWKDHPEYSRHAGYEDLYEEMLVKHGLNVDDWEKITRKNVKHKQWLQEYECSFLGTGDTYVDGAVLKQIKENVNENYYNKYNLRMRIWEDPNPQYEYLLAADSSMGRGRDNSAFHIINLYNGNQVAEFYSNQTPLDMFAKIIEKEATRYNKAFVMPERNGIGSHLIYHLFEVLEYENLYMDERGEFGVQITMKQREQILAEMEECLRTNYVKINSDRVLDELFTFIVNDETGKVEADEGKYDDLVMSLAIACYGITTIKKGTPIEYKTSDKEIKPLEITSGAKYDKGKFGMNKEDLQWLMK